MFYFYFLYFSEKESEKNTNRHLQKYNILLITKKKKKNKAQEKNNNNNGAFVLLSFYLKLNPVEVNKIYKQEIMLLLYMYTEINNNVCLYKFLFDAVRINKLKKTFILLI